MATLTSDRSTEYSLGDLLSIPVAGSTCIYAGSLVCVNAAGYAVPAADTAGLLIAGVATAQCDNGAGSDGDLSVVVRRRGRYRFNYRGALTQDAQGAKVYAADDQTVDDGAGVTNDILVGVIDKVEGAGECWLSIDAAVLAGKTWAEPTTTTAAPTTTTTGGA
ncbi:MAG: hypothetical protein J7M08_08590 [Planctomycetes bacterium]|nr:hypothetical protein [Planctomycetota bacterium]